MRKIRVLISSPGDAKDHRRSIDHAIHTVNRAIEASGDQVVLITVSWPNDVTPGADPRHPQLRIDDQLNFETGDILIAVFYRLLGAPVLDAPSGTAHEVRLGHEAWKLRGNPHLFVYFSNEAIPPPGGVNEATDNLRLAEFKDEVKDRKILYAEYNGVHEFERLITEHLLTHVMGAIRAKQFLVSPITGQIETFPADLRSEGYTEFVGDLKLTFAFPDDHMHGDFDVDLLLSTAIATPRGGSPRLIVFRPQAPPLVMEAKPFDDNQRNLVRFERVPFNPSDSHLVITNVRALAVAVGVSNTFTTARIVAVVTVRDRERTIEIKEQLTIGFVKRGLLADVFRVGSGPMVYRASDIEHGSVQPKPAFLVRFHEGFSGAFKTAAQEAKRYLALGPGQPTLLANPPADWGTRLALNLSSIPRGLKILVTCAEEQRPLRESRAWIVDTDANGAGGAVQRSSFKPRLMTSRGNPLIEVGSGNLVVWEWTDDSPLSADIRTSEFGLVLVGEDTRDLRGSMFQVAMGFAPFYTTARAHLIGIVPTFSPGTVPMSLQIT